MSKKESKVSVIVPIYNRESLMQKSVDSILNQTYKNIEVILVDDHSSDNSYKVMKEYTKKDSRVKAYTYKENKGAGHARNVGLDNATGNYIIFVDSDDYVDNDYIETLVNHIGDADMICCGYKNIDENGNVIKINKVKNNSYGMFRYPMIWGKMYTASSIKDNNVKFSDLRTGQDIRFIFEYNANIKKVVVLDYYTGINNVLLKSGRISNDKKIQKTRKVQGTLANIDNCLPKDSYKNLYSNEIYYFIMKELVFSVYNSCKISDFKSIREYNESGFNFIKDALTTNNIKIHLVKKYDNLLNYLAINSYIICNKIHLINLYIKIIKLMVG